MKQSIFTLLIQMFICTTMVCAQTGDEVTLSVGDPAPRFTPLKWIKGEPIGEFKKGHIYVLEFGATWCAPCAAAIPELTSLANKYKSDVTVVGAFVMEPNHDPQGLAVPSYVKRVEQYVAKRGEGIQYHVAVDDPNDHLEKTWLKAAGRTGIPHTFVIDRQGRIAWIGSNPKALENIIRNVQSTRYVVESMVKAHAVATSGENEYNLLQTMDKKTLESTIYFSHLSVYRDGQTGLANSLFVDNFHWAEAGQLAERQGRIQVLGESLRRLYYMAFGDTLWYNPPSMYPPGSGIYPDTVAFPHKKRSYGKYWYRPVLELSDSSMFDADYNSARNRFNYVLQVPRKKASSMMLQQLMQRDLRTCFGYEVVVEERLMPCWKLTVSDNSKAKLMSKAPGAAYRRVRDGNGIVHITNAQVRDLIFQLEIKYGHMTRGNLTHHPDKQPPFIDATGIRGTIDYSFDSERMNRLVEERKWKNNFEDYRKWLKEIGFDLERSYKKMKVVVIRDPEE